MHYDSVPGTGKTEAVLGRLGKGSRITSLCAKASQVSAPSFPRSSAYFGPPGNYYSQRSNIGKGHLACLKPNKGDPSMKKPLILNRSEVQSRAGNQLSFFQANK